MRVLGFDTATSACSAALWQDGRILARRYEAMVRGQSEHLIPMVLEVMNEAGVEFPDLDLVAVTRGPGAFTGLRIGLAAARGMALSGGLPCFGVTTFDAVAWAIPAEERQKGNLLVALDSRRADVFAQAYAPDLSPAGDAEAVLPEDLPAFANRANRANRGDGPNGPVLVAGDAADRSAEALEAGGADVILSAAPGAPDAASVAALAAERWSGEMPPAPPAPLYLRPPDAERPKDGGRLRP